jgi:hypothetical protein
MGAETVNTSCTVFFGTTVNWAGDTVDSNDPVITGLPVTLVETGKQVQDPSSPTPRTIRQITAIVPAYAGITSKHRLMDERTGDKYMVIAVTRPGTLTGAPVDIVCDLKRVSADGT